MKVLLLILRFVILEKIEAFIESERDEINPDGDSRNPVYEHEKNEVEVETDMLKDVNEEDDDGKLSLSCAHN